MNSGIPALPQAISPLAMDFGQPMTVARSPLRHPPVTAFRKCQNDSPDSLLQEELRAPDEASEFMDMLQRGSIPGHELDCRLSAAPYQVYGSYRRDELDEMPSPAADEEPPRHCRTTCSQQVIHSR